MTQIKNKKFFPEILTRSRKSFDFVKLLLDKNIISPIDCEVNSSFLMKIVVSDPDIKLVKFLVDMKIGDPNYVSKYD